MLAHKGLAATATFKGEKRPAKKLAEKSAAELAMRAFEAGAYTRPLFSST